MKKLPYILILLALVGLFVGLKLLKTSDQILVPLTYIPPAGPITIQGTMLCLPHKNTKGPQTTECAFGLKDDNGTYYGLSDTDPMYKNVSGVPMNTRVEVVGTFEPKSSLNYQDVGIISVISIKQVNKESVTPVSGSGIKGSTLLGPTCPVERIPPDPQCADRPYETTLAVTTVDGAKVVKQFKTDSKGNFSVSLPPGEYAVRSAAVANILPYCQSSGTVKVLAGKYTEITVSCDTGIR